MQTSKNSESIYEIIKKDYKLLIFLFFVGVLFYIYPICHQAITVDNDGHILDQTFGWYLRSKRWGICLIQKLLFLRTFVPGFWIVVNMAFLALATLLTSHLFSFKKPWLKYLFGILVICFPEYSHMMRPACTADAVGVGFLFVVLGFFLYSTSDSWKANIGAWLLFIATFSIYIALIYIPLTLFLLLSVINLSDDTITVGQWLKKALRLGLIVACAYLSYHLISLAILHHYHLSTTLPGYFEVMIRWGKDPLSEIFHKIPQLIGEHWAGEAYFGEKCFILIWIPFFVVLWTIIRNKVSHLSAKVLAIVLFLTTMVAPFIQIVLLGGWSNANVFLAEPFLFAAVWSLMFAYLPNISPKLAFVAVTILFIHNGYRMTQLHHFDSMLETAEKNFILRIISRIDDMGIDFEDHRLIVIGKKDIQPHFPNNEWSYVAGVPRMIFSSAMFRARMALHVHGFTKNLLTYPSRGQLDKLEPVIKTMPIWPAKDSVRLVDDVIIIKLSNDYNLKKDYPDWCLAHD